MFTMEWGVSRSVFKNLDLGVVGFWTDELSDFQYGSESTHFDSYAIGPEISMTFPKIGFATSLRYLRWFNDSTFQGMQSNGPSHIEGDTVVLTLTQRF